MQEQLPLLTIYDFKLLLILVFGTIRKLSKQISVSSAKLFPITCNVPVLGTSPFQTSFRSILIVCHSPFVLKASPEAKGSQS